mmetsp:Transcript_31485/g.60833  ORF Transcript_31485/g.60833 Transcript_31485/m.60833 type:complete len:234 (+) Transcript_31485:178-879(+)
MWQSHVSSQVPASSMVQIPRLEGLSPSHDMLATGKQRPSVRLLSVELKLRICFGSWSGVTIRSMAAFVQTSRKQLPLGKRLWTRRRHNCRTLKGQMGVLSRSMIHLLRKSFAKKRHGELSVCRRLSGGQRPWGFGWNRRKRLRQATRLQTSDCSGVLQMPFQSRSSPPDGKLLMLIFLRCWNIGVSLRTLTGSMSCVQGRNMSTQTPSAPSEPGVLASTQHHQRGAIHRLQES